MFSKRGNAVKMAFIISILCFVLAFLSLLSAGILFFRGGGNIFKVGRPEIFSVSVVGRNTSLFRLFLCNACFLLKKERKSKKEYFYM